MDNLNGFTLLGRQLKVDHTLNYKKEKLREDEKEREEQLKRLEQVKVVREFMKPGFKPSKDPTYASLTGVEQRKTDRKAAKQREKAERKLERKAAKKEMKKAAKKEMKKAAKKARKRRRHHGSKSSDGDKPAGGDDGGSPNLDVRLQQKSIKNDQGVRPEGQPKSARRDIGTEKNSSVDDNSSSRREFPQGGNRNRDRDRHRDRSRSRSRDRRRSRSHSRNRSPHRPARRSYDRHRSRSRDRSQRGRH